MYTVLALIYAVKEGEQQEMIIQQWIQDDGRQRHAPIYY